MSIWVETFGVCKIGRRAYNEDVYANSELMAGRCIAVADGAGGHRGGGIASRVLVNALMLSMAGIPQWNNCSILAAVDAASAAVRAQQLKDQRLRSMMSTLVLLCLDTARRTAFWTHLGDSRLYYLGQQLERLTLDHSVVQSFVDSGLLTASEGRTSVNRSVLYAAVGAESETRPVVGTRTGLKAGDAFLLCTDGVWDVV